MFMFNPFVSFIYMSDAHSMIWVLEGVYMRFNFGWNEISSTRSLVNLLQQFPWNMSKWNSIRVHGTNTCEWNTSTYEWHSNDIRVHTNDIRVTMSLVCHSNVTRMYSYIILVLLVCVFTMNPHCGCYFIAVILTEIKFYFTLDG